MEFHLCLNHLEVGKRQGKVAENHKAVKTEEEFAVTESKCGEMPGLLELETHRGHPLGWYFFQYSYRARFLQNTHFCNQKINLLQHEY